MKRLQIRQDDPGRAALHQPPGLQESQPGGHGLKQGRRRVVLLPDQLAARIRHVFFTAQVADELADQAEMPQAKMTLEVRTCGQAMRQA
jgi:hypothetical protein